MDLLGLTRAISRQRNLLLVEGRSLSDPEYQTLLAEREAFLNPPPEVEIPKPPVKSKKKK